MPDTAILDTFRVFVLSSFTRDGLIPAQVSYNIQIILFNNVVSKMPDRATIHADVSARISSDGLFPRISYKTVNTP